MTLSKLERMFLSEKVRDVFNAVDGLPHAIDQYVNFVHNTTTPNDSTKLDHMLGQVANVRDMLVSLENLINEDISQ